MGKIKPESRIFRNIYIPSHLMNSMVFLRPHGVKVRMIFLGVFFFSLQSEE